jgi:hypothetical protein
MNKSISQIQFLERQLLELEKLSTINRDNFDNYSLIKSELSKLKGKRLFLWKIENFISLNKWKVKKEKIFNSNYFSIYFSCAKENIYSDADCILFKKILTAKSSELKTIEDKEVWITETSPPAFWGNYMNKKIAKLSIPEFVYERDIDISNLVDRVFQSNK